MSHNAPQRSTERLRTRVAVFVCLAAVLIGIDQLTKALAEHYLSNGTRIEVIPHFLNFSLLYNPGATLGIGADHTWAIALLQLAACIVLVVLVFRTVSLRWVVALSLAFAGAGGNLLDRIMQADGFMNGPVTDFLDYGWSVGNVADVYLSVAAVIIVVLVFMNVAFSAPATPETDGDDE